MAWYRTGTVTVTNGSATVTGAGTAFVEAVLAGDAFVGPDGRTYEVAAVVSATQFTLAIGYLGSTQAGAAYAIQPTQGRVIEQNALLEALLTAYQSVYNGPGQGKFADGTPAAPGMRFASDADTGLTRPAANQIGLVAGGTLRALLSSAAMEINVPVTGTAVQATPGDTTAGRLLRVGAFGLGTDAISFSNDPNLVPKITTPFALTSLDSTNKPAARRFAGQRYMRSPSTGVDFIGACDSGFLEPRLFTRPIANDVYGNWAELFHTRNVLGTVSQASGVPTGAVIESGSNANGRYTRWADGTQICTKDNTAITAAPAAFTGTITKIDGDKLWIGRWF